jgi:hypothetical protein
MMRKLMILTVPAILAASPVLAQTADVTGTVSIDGSVAGRCMFTIPNKTISLGELSLASNGKLDVSKVNGRSETLTGWCNYTATATTGAVSANDASLTAGAGSASTVGLFSGTINVVLSAASSPNNGLMVAGIYTGNVVVTLTPSIALPPG